MSVAAPSSLTTGSASAAISAPESTSTDLTSQLLPHLDRHLVLPLLDFLESRGAHSHEEVLKAKYDLLKPTNMVTYVLGLKRELEGTAEDAEVPQGQSSTRFILRKGCTRVAGQLGGSSSVFHYIPTARTMLFRQSCTVS